MPDLSRSELAAYAACVVLVVLLGWRVLRTDRVRRRRRRRRRARGATTTTGGSEGPSVSVAPARDGSATVHVVGAVRRPGVYRLRLGQRVEDAIRRAGGASGAGDLQAINLAAKIAGRSAGGGAAAGGGGRGGWRGGGAPAAAAGAVVLPGERRQGPINLNSATAEQLDTLDGVGPATAAKILEYRAQHGGFSRSTTSRRSPGIGPKKLEALKAVTCERCGPIAGGEVRS